MKIVIDTKEIADEMEKEGFDGKDYYEGWSDYLLDLLEKKYKLESYINSELNERKSFSRK